MNLTLLWIDLLRGALELSTGSAFIAALGAALVVIGGMTRRLVFLLLPLGFGLLIGGLGGFNPTNAFGYLYTGGISTSFLPLAGLFLLGFETDFLPLLARPRLLAAALPVALGIFGSFILAGALGFPLKEAATVALAGSLNPASLLYAANALSPDLVGPLGLVTAFVLILLRWSASRMQTAPEPIPQLPEEAAALSEPAGFPNLLIFALVIVALVGVFFRPGLPLAAAFFLGVVFRREEAKGEAAPWVRTAAQIVIALTSLAIGCSLSAGVLFTPVALEAVLAVIFGAVLTFGGSWLILRSARIEASPGRGGYFAASTLASILPGIELVGILVTSILMTIVLAVS